MDVVLSATVPAFWEDSWFSSPVLILTDQALSPPGPPVIKISLQLQGTASHFACMAASAFQAYLYKLLPPSAICICTNMRELRKTKRENHLSPLSAKVNDMDTSQVFTTRYFLGL